MLTYDLKIDIEIKEGRINVDMSRIRRLKRILRSNSTEKEQKRDIAESPRSVSYDRVSIERRARLKSLCSESLCITCTRNPRKYELRCIREYVFSNSISNIDIYTVCEDCLLNTKKELFACEYRDAIFPDIWYRYSKIEEVLSPT